LHDRNIGGATASYYIDQDFNSGSQPSGWTTTASGGGAVNWAYTPAIEGAYSVRLSSAGTGNIRMTSPVFAGTSAGVYATAMVNFPIAPNYTHYAMRIENSSHVSLAEAVFNGTAKLGASAVGGSASYGSTTLLINTTYYIQLRYIPGTGSNATASVWLSENGVDWTQQGSTVTNGTATTDPAYVAVQYNMGADNGYVWDYIRVSDDMISY